MELRVMEACDYERLAGLWRATPGVRLVAADAPGNIAAFLTRNPGMSFVAEQDGLLIGTAMCGHDGRRGYLYHVAVLPEYRRRGIGTALVQACMDALCVAGIDKCHVFVLEDNEPGKAFWASGWTRREDIALFSLNL